MSITQNYPATQNFASSHVEEFVKGYLECALWASTDDRENGAEHLDENFDIDDFRQKDFDEIVEDCRKFMEDNWNALITAKDRRGFELSSAGHDYWLTRNGHGAGYWDRKLGAAGKSLTKSSDAAGGVNIFPDDEGKLYCEGE